MIKANHSHVYERFFSWFIYKIIRRNFHAVKHIDCGYTAKSGSMLAIGNHVSWWDGFWMLKLNKVVIKKKFHILMLEKQLKPRMFFNKLGAIGITKNSKDIIHTLHYCSEVLNEKNALLFFFPEGEINPMNSDKVHFEKGVMRIIKNTPKLQLLMVVNLTEYFSNKKPTLFTFYKSVDAKQFDTIDTLQENYNTFLSECKLKLKTT